MRRNYTWYLAMHLAYCIPLRHFLKNIYIYIFVILDFDFFLGARGEVIQHRTVAGNSHPRDTRIDFRICCCCINISGGWCRSLHAVHPFGELFVLYGKLTFRDTLSFTVNSFIHLNSWYFSEKACNSGKAKHELA